MDHAPLLRALQSQNRIVGYNVKFAELEAPALQGVKKDMVAALCANRRKPRHTE